MIQKVIISAPFGNHVRFEGATSTLGTFTYMRRGGRLHRLWRILRTLRYDRRTGGWVNKLGLPNPGIGRFKKQVRRGLYLEDKIVSVLGFTGDEWSCLLKDMNEFTVAAVELNVSCPNIDNSLSGGVEFWHQFFESCVTENRTDRPLIVKIPPVRYHTFVEAAALAEIKTFHACNTLPCKAGGMSGPILTPLVLDAIKFIKKTVPDSTIIAGGGVKTTDDAIRYFKAGADHVALGSALLNPFRRRRLKRTIQWLNDTPKLPYLHKLGSS